jgi:hypothetical protein
VHTHLVNLVGIAIRPHGLGNPFGSISEKCHSPLISLYISERIPSMRMLRRKKNTHADFIQTKSPAYISTETYMDFTWQVFLVKLKSVVSSYSLTAYLRTGNARSCRNVLAVLRLCSCRVSALRSARVFLGLRSSGLYFLFR